MPLIKACIQRPGNGLHQQDLLRLARHLALAPTQGLEFPDNAAYDDLLKAIALNVSDNDNEFADFVLKMSKKTLKNNEGACGRPIFRVRL